MNNKFLSLLRAIKSSSMATVDEHGRPQIRIIDVMLVKGDVLFFCTSRGKDFYKELLATKHIAILGMTEDCHTIRVQGEAIHLGCDKDLVDEIFTENPVMKGVYPGESRYILDIFCVKDASVESFDLSKLPITREYSTIGNASPSIKGFIIEDSCIACGICAKACPQQCITKAATLYEITQAHCLHCGFCAEQCPTGAIKRK